MQNQYNVFLPNSKVLVWSPNIFKSYETVKTMELESNLKNYQSNTCKGDTLNRFKVVETFL